MTDQERDDLLLSLKEGQNRLEAGQAELKADLATLSDHIQDVARAVRELGGDVDDPPVEATG